MNLEDLQRDPFLMKFVQRLARMLALDYQNRASDMSADELYEDADFFPLYNPEKQDYTSKPEGYTCRSNDGHIMRLVSAESVATMEIGDDGEPITKTAPVWGYIWSKNPQNAKPYVYSELCPYNEGDCCLWEGEVYVSQEDVNYSSPEQDPNAWKKFSGGEFSE